MKQDTRSHTDFQAKTGQGDRNNLQQSGLPSGVASFVVQDYAPNNLRSGVTTYSITCRKLTSKVQNKK